MWFWGSILGLFAGASIGGWSGAFWGAIIGWIAGLLLGRKGSDAEAQVKNSALEQRLAATQKALEDVQRRLARLEKNAEGAGVRIEPAASSAEQKIAAQPESSEAVTVAATSNIVVAAAITPPPVPVEEIAEAAATAPAMATSVAKADIEPPAEISSQSEAPAVAARSSAPSTLAANRQPSKAPPPTPEPAGPGFIERMLEGNIVAKLGVVILFFGVGFLLKFAYDRGMFPPQMRLFAVAAASGVMFFIGRRLMESSRTYALVLMGGAMGLLYLDVFFALKTFGIIGPTFGFVLFAALGIATLWLAVRMDARAFAALGLFGAFLAPVLASTGGGNHVLLFSYYLLLNLIILAASWFKSWRELNFIGFLFTFAIALLWGNSTYRPEHFATLEPFLIAFFLLYLAIPILFAHRQPPQLKGIVDGTLVFGVPMSVAMMQAALTSGMGDYILAWSALGAALVYGGLAWALWRRENMRLLAEAHLALAIVFGTVAPYFAFNGYPTFAFWTLEGAAIYWMGCRQKSVLARGFAIFLQLAAAGYFWSVIYDQTYASPWLNDRVVGCALIAAASLLTAWFMHKFEENISTLEADMQAAAIGWSGAWLLLATGLGVWAQWAGLATRLAAMLQISAAVFVVFELLGSWLNWRLLRLTSRFHIVLMGVIALWWFDVAVVKHPLADEGAWAWPLSFVAYFFVLHRQRMDGVEADRGWRYTLGWVLMIALATWEAMWRYDHREYVWVWVIGIAGLIASAVRFRLRGQPAAEDTGLQDAKKTAPPGSLSNLPMWWSLIWWFAGIHGLIETHSASQHHLAWHLAAGALSIILFEFAGSALAWPALRRTQVLLTALMIFAALHLIGHGFNPFHGMQFMAWLLAFVMVDFALARQERDEVAVAPSIQHVLLFAVALWLVGCELLWRTEQAGLSVSWQYAVVGITLAGGMALIAFAVGRSLWPFATHATTFRNGALMPLMVLGLLWTLAANAVCDGNSSPLPYLPLLNPLDLAQLALVAAGVWSLKRLVDDIESNRILTLMLSAAAFYWVNAALLRTVHQWADVPFELPALLHSVVAQSALSLLWTTTALVLMFSAGKKASRALWMTGAALLGVVVLKLFVNDLGSTGTVARIVSFIGVGVLLLVIGYVAPVPPSSAIAERKGERGAP